MPPRYILIAPNVSEQMGGEAAKALQIFRELQKASPDVVQITHARNRGEVDGRLKLKNVRFVDDTAVSLFLWRIKPLRLLLDPWFSWKAVRMADRIAAETPARETIVWQTEPNSPVAPRAMSSRHFNVLGPINGNIYYPAEFRGHESSLARVRRVTHMPLQRLQRAVWSTLRRANLILVAGGERTKQSLLAAGCSDRLMLETPDCGVDASLLERPRISHLGRHPRFVHFGRLVFHKGTALIIRALTKSQPDIRLDIVGRGPELETCKALVAELGLQERVRFLDWYPAREDLLASLSGYRGLVLPSLEDANGMVVQEGMALGLPPICLDWGGPQLLIEHGVSGYLVPTGTADAIAAGLARHMDELAADGEHADRMSVAARSQAQAWRWPTLTVDWMDKIEARAKAFGEARR
jgi:glycosyltransferase involved in cell wall biosynthesis